MKNRKIYLGFHILKICHILKHFTGAFYLAQTLKLFCECYYISFFVFHISVANNTYMYLHQPITQETHKSQQVSITQYPSARSWNYSLSFSRLTLCYQQVDFFPFCIDMDTKYLIPRSSRTQYLKVKEVFTKTTLVGPFLVQQNIFSLVIKK